METASFSYGKTPRIPRRGLGPQINESAEPFLEYVGTALQSRPARAIIGLKTRTGLETRPHMFYQFAEKARNWALVITKSSLGAPALPGKTSFHRTTLEN